MMRIAVLTALFLAGPALAADNGASAAAPAVKAARKLEIKVTENGFEPREVTLRKGEPTTLVFTRVTEHTCITAIDVPDENIKAFHLPLNRPVYLTVTPKKAGIEPFHCTAMGMGGGKLRVND